ncbi:MAG TPA: hypothetical protein VF813_08205 [Anaerolineaceae bacterium]
MRTTAAESFPETKKASPSGEIFWNLLTFLMLLVVIGLLGIFALRRVDPRTLLQPFQAATASGPVGTAPAAALVPTGTQTPPALIETTATPEAASSSEVSTALPPTLTAPAGEAPTPSGGYAFQARPQPNWVASTVMHPDAGCGWLGVGGETFDLGGSPLVGMTVHLSGTLAGKPVDLLSLSGTATEYGPAGYEINLGEKPLASADALWLQLQDQAGLPLSGRVPVETRAGCDQNLVLINFRQTR